MNTLSLSILGITLMLPTMASAQVPADLSEAQAQCVQTALDARYASMKPARATFQKEMGAAREAFATATHAAWDMTNTQERQDALKSARQEFKKSGKTALQKYRASMESANQKARAAIEDCKEL